MGGDVRRRHGRGMYGGGMGGMYGGGMGWRHVRRRQWAGMYGGGFAPAYNAPPQSPRSG